jgi:hypothetical protein
MKTDQTSKQPTPAALTPVTGSACIVYSGPHYGRTHRYLGQKGTLVWVEYEGHQFSVPYCDVEMCSPKT